MTAPRSVVVVDDSPTIRATLAHILQREGYEVTVAAHGREGLELIRSRRPKAVIVDAMMPELDGFALCEMIRSDPEIASTSVVMLTSMAQSVDERHAYDVGVDHFLTKPLDAEQLLRVLDGIFSI